MQNLDSLYELRNKFIIIGLTGRLGSGCTTVANILASESFEKGAFPLLTSVSPNGNEYRKYKISHQFLEKN